MYLHSQEVKVVKNREGRLLLALHAVASSKLPTQYVLGTEHNALASREWELIIIAHYLFLSCLILPTGSKI